MDSSFKSHGVTGATIIMTNLTDADGNPTGGFVTGTGLNITWQNGLVSETENGALLEDLLEVCAKRLEYYQAGKFSCKENRDALLSIQNAQKSLADRRKDRKDRGVENTHQE